LTTLTLTLTLTLNYNIHKDQYTALYNKMDPKWKERIARHGYGINVVTALEEDLEGYMETKIYEYIYKNFTDYTL